ncbi:TIGR04222 domain-containing membrane protein [Actinomadura chokoriensis]|uniref:TIGR04222 domain-containing membrane protein n=1 Tax=Actinomadura chokoriensis TaxID=454156 RepID=UPI0031F82A97
MKEGGSALAAGIFAVHVLVAVALLMILWGVRRRLVRGRPPTRDLRPYEIAYLGGLDLGAVAASLAALLLDGAIEARADGRLAATGTSSGGPGEPLDAAIPGRARRRPEPDARRTHRRAGRPGRTRPAPRRAGRAAADAPPGTTGASSRCSR